MNSARKYATRTGIGLRLIQGGGMGDGIARGQLSLVGPVASLTPAPEPSRTATTKPITMARVKQLERRLKEIETAYELADLRRDRDVVANLEVELDQIILELQTAYGAIQLKKATNKRAKS
jgi:hypothetical protein